MSRALRLTALLVLLSALPAAAQQTDTSQVESDRSIVESTLQNVMGVIDEVSFQQMRGAMREALLRMANRLDGSERDDDARFEVLLSDSTVQDYGDLAAALRQLRGRVRDLRGDALERGDEEAARRLARVAGELERLADDVQALEDRGDAPLARADEDEWLRSGEDRDEAPPEERDRGWRGDRRWEDRDGRGYSGRQGPFADGHDDVYVFGWGSDQWPFHQQALYRPIPAIRYNRVEGLVLGIGVRPLGWGTSERSRLYGQAAYAFQLDEHRLRYEIGLETKPTFSRRAARRAGFKLGGAYHRNTATNDAWKVDWTENTLASLLFKNDFLDYYEVEGWTAYSVQRLGRFGQVSAGYRADEYRSLERNTNWSVFRHRPFRLNPGVEEGWMHSAVVALEAGQVAGLYGVPRGSAFRAEAEFGDGLGGDFAFNRYLADGRLYLPTGEATSLGLRLRGGLASDGAPVQKWFTLGGLGSVRAYPQNAYAGTRMLLGNAEFVLDDVALFEDVLDDFQFFVFADAGWVGGDFNRTIRTDDVLAAAGLGIGLDDRRVRLEIAWPLNDAGRSRPVLWFRLDPTF